MIKKEIKCRYCRRDISTMSITTHEAHCRGENESNSRHRIFDESYESGNSRNNYERYQARNNNSTRLAQRVPVNVYNTSNSGSSGRRYPKVPTKFRKEAIGSRSALRNQSFIEREPEVVICHKCSEKTTSEDYENHVSNCEYSPCMHCYEYYPNVLVPEHMKVCDQNPEKNQQLSNFLDDYGNQARQQQNRQEEMRRQQQRQQQRQRQRQQQRGGDLNNFLQMLGIIPQNARASQNQARTGQTARQQMPAPRRTMVINTPDGRVIQRSIYSVPNGTIIQENGSDDELNESVFLENDSLEDEYGRTSLYGRDPTDPLMSSRAFTRHTPTDPFENMLREFVNLVRTNRHNRQNPGFIRILFSGIPGAGQQSQGLNENTLNQINRETFKKEENVREGEEEKCPICLTDLQTGEEIKRLPCKHIFHPNCIDPWLSQNSKCPICKKDVGQGLHGGSGGSRRRR